MTLKWIKEIISKKKKKNKTHYGWLVWILVLPGHLELDV